MLRAIAMFHLEKDLAASMCLVMVKERMSHWISIIFIFPLVDSLHDVVVPFENDKG